MQQSNIEEVLIKKISVYKSKINEHVVDTVLNYITNNLSNFKSKSWNCNILTSLNISKNILFDINEFKYVREHIEKLINILLIQNFNKEIPFMIHMSWINILGKKGYQEFHKHTDSFGSGVLYLTEDNSSIEFTVFPEDTRKQIIPKKYDILIFDSETFHRVLESEKERYSLAFNFKINNDF
jgi:hypothetical protein|tara:strand:+ start:194 stop:739 length:546 start_codon:yes stop_codon:yes gene_type:complete